MRISRIYYDGSLGTGSTVAMPFDSSHYLQHVLRLDVGSELIVFNGDGNDYQATVVQVQKKTVFVQIGDGTAKLTESPLKIHLAQAISRNEKMDWILQKAVELGVSKITPLLTRFCNIKLTHERMEKRLAHWQKIIYSACEQTGRSTLPLLEPISLFPEWIKTQSAQLMVYCDPTAPQGISALPESREVLVLIGPEGGLSQQEIIEAQEQNFIGISLGPRILRTETAALVAISLFQCQWGDINPSTQV